MPYVTRTLLIVSLWAAFNIAACSHSATVPKVTGTNLSPLKNRISSPDPSKYRSIKDAYNWLNPYLIVETSGIQARPIRGNPDIQTMSPQEAVAYLEQLPSTAWPYGLVVAVQENGVRAVGGSDDARINKNRDDLLRLLREAGVQVDLWPSA